MKTTKLKHCAVALAFAACLSAPVALVACGNVSSNNGNFDDVCEVEFDAGRGTIFSERFFRTTVERGAKVDAPSEQPVPESDDYIFVGWNVTGDERDVMWDFDSDVVTNDTILYAVWARACTVTFEANGGEFADGNDTYTVKVAYESKLTAPSVVAPDGNHVLSGWYYGYTQWDFASDAVNSQSITITAKWDLSDDIKTALAPFEYEESSGGAITVTGVKDKSVTSLTVPSVVTAIDDDAFKECDELVSAVISDSVKELGYRIFADCAKLKSVTLPVGLTSLPANIFNGCESLESINIPDTVTSIGNYAFGNCTALKSVTLPVGVAEIPSGLFVNCTALESVELKGQVTALGAEMFSGCESLAAFDIPSGITSIPMSAFKNCKALTSIDLPAGCVSIGSYAFSGCSGIKSINIGDNVESIGSRAFDNCVLLADISLGASVEVIDSGAFAGCVSLTEVEMSDTVSSLGSYAFDGCTALKSVKMGDGVGMINISTFRGCTALRDVTIGGGVKSILENAFYGCASLLDITIPANVTYINNSAFSLCSRLVEAYNLSTAELRNARVIHTDATEESIIKRTTDGFAFCELKVSNVTSGWYLVDYNGTAQNVVLPADYEGGSYRLLDYALAYNKNIKSVELSEGVTEIGSYLLAGSDNVTTLTVASGNTAYSSVSNCVVATAEKKFMLGCKTSVIPEDGSVTEIGSHVFCGNSFEFDGEFKIPACVTDINAGAFVGCDSIMRTENNIVYVDKWAVSVDYDGRDLIDLVVVDGTVGIAGGAFGLQANEYGVPDKIASVELPDGLKYICDDAFYDCGNLTNISLPDGLLSLGGTAFGLCDKLTEVYIPDSVETVGSSLFHSCAALTYVRLPDGLGSIGYQTFYGCTSLKTLVIPSSVTNIEHSVFKGCSAATLSVYYGGAAEQWKFITIQPTSNDAVKSARRYYYSETEASGLWHYDEDGKPTLWA